MLYTVLYAHKYIFYYFQGSFDNKQILYMIKVFGCMIFVPLLVALIGYVLWHRWKGVQSTGNFDCENGQFPLGIDRRLSKSIKNYFLKNVNFFLSK